MRFFFRDHPSLALGLSATIVALLLAVIYI
jgi:hypothetical protein